MQKGLLLILHLYMVLIFASCSKDNGYVEHGKPYNLQIPAGFPQPEIPEDNLLTEERVALGKMLFFDPILSRDYSVSCASCHIPGKAFSDSKQFSEGVEGRLGFRNAPSLANVAYVQDLNRDGGMPTLERQVLVPIGEHDEMDMTISEIVIRLKEHKDYTPLFKKAYNMQPDPFSLTRAIAAFERTLISGNSAFDKYYFQGRTEALDDSEKRGMALFFGDKANCSGCHGGFNFTNGEFINNGLYEDYSSDAGRMRITLSEDDIGKFRVPTLRNIALTAPYMHDGSLKTLGDVITHYKSGGSMHPNKDDVLKPFELTSAEEADLISFLKSLTDYEFITNGTYKPES